MKLNDIITEAEKTRLDPKCWTGKKIGNPKTKVKGGVRVNNCVPAESINEFVDTQQLAQDPEIEKERDVAIIFYGFMPKDFSAETVWEALEAVLPGEYPPGQNKQGYPTSNAERVTEKISKQGGAVVTLKPLSVAKKLVKTFQTYGIKCRIDTNESVAESKANYNFDIEDLKRLERIRDLATLKAQALALISKPSAKPMKPEKVEWFKNAMERMNSPLKVIKLMYDLLLSGEGNAVVGTKSSMNPNSYRQRFGEQGMAEDYNPEYDDEAGMADNNLETLKRTVEGIDDLIQTGDNLPEWCQEKIAVAKSMLVSVWDYMYSEEASDEVDPEIDAMYEAMESLVEEIATRDKIDVDLVWESFESLDDHMLYETAAWRRKEGKSKSGGLNAKGVASYRRENPGSKLQTAVTTKPSKLKPGSKAAKRRKSFCARMGGVKGPMKKPNGKPTRKALALRKWNC